MLGAYRYLLSLLVMQNHQVYALFDQLNWIGKYAVYTFFTLSGYLMTRVMHETYGYSIRGAVGFLLNRALRIYPGYWVAVTTTVILLVFLPHAPGTQSDIVYLPARLGGYFWNYVILGMTWGVTPALVYPVWSLHVELIFYALMAAGLSATRGTTVAWFLASVAYEIWAVAHGWGFSTRYSDVTGASISVASGAMIWHFRHWRRPWMVVFPVLYFVHDLAASHLWDDVLLSGWFVSLALGTFTILYLSEVRMSPRVARWDHRLGDLAFPIFLFHLQLGYLIQTVAPQLITGPWSLWLWTLVPVHVVAWAVDTAVISPMERLRRYLKTRARA